MGELGNKISVCRQNMNLTQEELAKRLGVTAQAVSKWERGVSMPDVSLLTSLCQILEVSGDYLLGLEDKKTKKDSRMQDAFSEKILSNLRNSLEPLELIFGKDITPLFLEGTYIEKIADMRTRLSREGILVPVIRLRDEMLLDDNEFMVLAYQNILYMEKVDSCALEYIMEKLEGTIRNSYAEILNPDITKCLVDNLKLKYPALIDGVVPEKISYGLLTQVLKDFLCRGNAMVYLPRVIEFMQYERIKNPGAGVEELTEAIVKGLETENNFWVHMGTR